MPLDNLHKKKFKTNMAIFALVLGLCALIWAITMVRIGSGS